ncbi:hypothetical protein PR048_010770 [Dryococelus australis]|uniref:Uncharacterized protein n=1 Tax=Dryococelus australis TaxID=614101 RepID=A0ABQ9I3L9_9NEOP|nr:hypothetical protein PR048_010770 [Dryococelus australis]
MYRISDRRQTKQTAVARRYRELQGKLQWCNTQVNSSFKDHTKFETVQDNACHVMKSGSKGVLTREHRACALYLRIPSGTWGRGGAAARALTSQQGEHGSILGGVAPRFPQVGIVPDDAVGRRIFSVISRSQDISAQSPDMNVDSSSHVTLRSLLKEERRYALLTCLPMDGDLTSAKIRLIISSRVIMQIRVLIRNKAQGRNPCFPVEEGRYYQLHVHRYTSVVRVSSCFGQAGERFDTSEGWVFNGEPTLSVHLCVVCGQQCRRPPPEGSGVAAARIDPQPIPEGRHAGRQAGRRKNVGGETKYCLGLALARSLRLTLHSVTRPASQVFTPPCCRRCLQGSPALMYRAINDEPDLANVSRAGQFLLSDWLAPVYPEHQARMPLVAKHIDTESHDSTREEPGSVKAVHDKVNTFEINLGKKTLLLPAYILTGALSGMHPVKLVTMEGKVVPYLNVE